MNYLNMEEHSVEPGTVGEPSLVYCADRGDMAPSWKLISCNTVNYCEYVSF